MKPSQGAVTFEIPLAVPMPKFDLFQEVRIIGKRRLKTGVITGIYYEDLNTALLQHSDTVGWNYIVNFAIGQSQERLMQLVNKDDAVDYLSENEIELLVEVAA